MKRNTTSFISGAGAVSARIRHHTALLGAVLASTGFLAAMPVPVSAAGYAQTNLIASNSSYGATIVDPTLLNAWGIAIRPAGLGGHFWITSNVAGTSNQYVGDVVSNPVFADDLRLVSVPGPTTGNHVSFGTPTGVVFNPGSGFVITQGSVTAASKFIFATDNGTISAWTERKNPDGSFDRAGNARLMVDRSAAGDQYFGLAMGPGNNHIHVANFGANAGIQTYDSNFSPVVSAGAFASPFSSGPTVHAGDYVPFNIQTLSRPDGTSSIFVPYAKSQEDPGNPGHILAGEEVSGAGLGRLAEFDAAGNLLHTWDDRGLLNAPWGLAFAPQGFGEYSDKLLVGNFGDGTIVAFDPATHRAIDYLRDDHGNVITIDGLWGLQFGNGASLGMSNALYFAAGPKDETEGLFGRLMAPAAPVPEPESWVLLSAGLVLMGFVRRRKSQETGSSRR